MALNFRGVPEFAADALHGVGVFDTLRSLGMRVLRRLGADEGTSAASRAHAALRTPHVGTATLETAVTRPHGVRAVAVPAPSELAIAGVGG